MIDLSINRILPASRPALNRICEIGAAALAFASVAFFVSFVLVLGSAVSASAAGITMCEGRNLLVQMQAENPEKLTAIEREAAQIPNGEGIFWRVELEGGEPSWLLGTMHMADPRIARLDASRMAAFDAADTVIVENTESLDPKKAQAAMLAMQHLTMIRDGSNLTQKLPPEAVKLLEPALEARGIPFQIGALLQPWVVATSVAVPVCEMQAKAGGAPVLDALIAQSGLSAGKQVIGLETIEEQFSAMASLPEDFHLRSLEETLELGDLAEDVTETMKVLYLEGRIGMVQPLLKAVSPKTTSSAGYAGFQQQLIDERNAVMAERSLPHLEKGNVFIAVGALHLPGKTGLIEAFRKAGYYVSRAD